MNKDAISIIQQQADTDDKKQKILIVDDSKFNIFGYQYATNVMDAGLVKNQSVFQKAYDMGYSI